MQADDAERLHRRWGGRPCNHPDVDRLYDRGVRTGKYACTVCGAIFERRPKDDAATLALIVKSGVDAGKWLSIAPRHEYVFGHDPPSHVRLACPDVSPKHCVVRATREGLFVRDLRSDKGTLVNETAIKEETRLRPGDRLAIGSFLFEVAERVVPAAAEPPPDDSSIHDAAEPPPDDSAIRDADEPRPSDSSIHDADEGIVEQPSDHDTVVQTGGMGDTAVHKEIPGSEEEESADGKDHLQSYLVARVLWDVDIVYPKAKRLDLYNALKFFNELSALAGRSSQKKIVIDLSGVEYMHSSGLVRLLDLNRDAKLHGGGLCLCNLKSELRELFKSAGLTKAIDISDGQWAAVKMLRGEER